MTKEQLMKPRYKVIADYPESIFKVGDIKDTLCFSINGITGHPVYFDKYPHLFKKLEWWEDLQPEEMPEYIKSWGKTINHNRSFSDIKIRCGVDEFWNSKDFSIDNKGFVTAYGGIIIECFFPSTREEYEAQQNTPCKP